LVTGSFSDRLSNLLERVSYRPIESEEDRETIFRLRYDAYLRDGVVKPHLTRKVHDQFDEAENSWIFGLYIEDRLVSSLRICVSLPEYPMTPSIAAFPDVLGSEVERGRIIIDPNRFVTDYEASCDFPELPYLTTRLCVVSADYFDADMVIACVRREHQAFYRRVFLCEPVCELRPYPGLTKPFLIMTVACRSARPKIMHRYPSFHSTFFERRMLFERPSFVPRRTAAMLEEKLPAANVDEPIETVAPAVSTRR
jgi:hypothetical protein